MNEFLYNPPTKLDSVFIGGIALRKGDRVRIQPKALDDALNIALAGRIAFIETIEAGVDEKTHLGLVLEDEPADDLAFDHAPGHRFFYTTDEVEPLEGE
jgi:hypothetical protein